MTASDTAGSAELPLSDYVASLLRDVPDFPLPGIVFKDIGPLLATPGALGRCVAGLAEVTAAADLIAGVEARGFIFAAAQAQAQNAGLVLVRKAGKLPPPTVTARYELEYGSAEIEVPLGMLQGRRVFLVDDVLATGGTLAASAALLRQAGAVVTGIGVIIELVGLNGRARLPGETITSLLTV